MDKWIKSIFPIESMKKYSAWFCVAFGVLSYLVAFIWTDNESKSHEIALQAGNVLLCGGVLGLLTTVAQSMGVFKEELAAVLSDHLYEDKCLENRKDIESLWRKVSTIVYGNRFKKINDDLLDAIKEYLPKEKVSYYYKYNIHTSVKWKHDDHGASGELEVTDVVSFTLAAKNKDEFCHPIKMWTPVKGSNDYRTEITEIKLDGEDIEGTDAECDETDGEQLHRIEKRLRLAGKTKYPIKYKRTSVYNIKNDNTLGFNAEYIVNDLTVSLSLPEELSATFVNCGTLKKFSIGNSDGDRQMERKYEGIILPKQGYVFALQHREHNNGQANNQTPQSGVSRYSIRLSRTNRMIDAHELPK